MGKVNKDPKMASQEKLNDNMDKGPIDDLLNSDNAFNDVGLENMRLLNEAIKRSKENKARI